MSDYTIEKADLTNSNDAKSVVYMLQEYAKDPMGNGKPLDDSIVDGLIQKMIEFGKTHVFLVKNEHNKAVGIANCFEGFSTFYASKILNIHDLSIHKEHRSQGLGKALLDYVSSFAKKEGFAKVTLEVRTDNPAERLYRRNGFNSGSTEYEYFFLNKYLK